MEILEGNDEEIELSLGLSIGGGRSFKKFEKPNQEKSSLTFEMKFLDQNDNINGLDLEKRKKEIHKLRRQEARKKRDIKKNGRKPEQQEHEEDEQSTKFKKLKPENEEEKGHDIGSYPPVMPSMQYGGYNHLNNPFSNGFGFPSGAYQMMPYWVPPPPAASTSSSPETVAVVDDKNVLVQPIVCKPFVRPFQFSDSPPMDKISRDSDSCGSAVVEVGSQFDNETSTTRSAQSPPLNQPHPPHESNNVQVQSGNINATSRPQILTLGIKQDTPNVNKIIASPNSITSTQSNLSSSSSSSKSVEEPVPTPNSLPMTISTSKTEFPPQILQPLQQLKCANVDSYKPPVPRYPRQSKGSNEECSKPPLPVSPKKATDNVETDQMKKATNEEETNKSPKGGDQQIKGLPKMPCVSTVGDGPNGKTITGFLYRYTNAEVSIVCVCHGSSFSPAEFVKHAGRTDVSQPLKHIVVLPTPFG